jgi:hypothetical protein
VLLPIFPKKYKSAPTAFLGESSATFWVDSSGT